jgi:hypothetical protein
MLNMDPPVGPYAYRAAAERALQSTSPQAAASVIGLP